MKLFPLWTLEMNVRKLLPGLNTAEGAGNKSKDSNHEASDATAGEVQEFFNAVENVEPVELDPVEVAATATAPHGGFTTRVRNGMKLIKLTDKEPKPKNMLMDPE